MTRSKSIIGALVLCAVSICAFAAASASATGLTAVQCEKVASGKYNNSHCTTPQSPGEFETVAIPENTSKEIEGTDTREITKTEHGLGSTANPVAVFHSTFIGIATTVTCGTGNTTGGKLENVEEGGEMKIKTTGSSVTWTECHASPKTEPTRSCKVQGTAPAEPENAIKTNPLTSTTGPEHKVVIKPVEGATFTKFKVLGNSTPTCFTPINVEVTVAGGEAWGRANTETHSHLTLDEASNAGSPLTANGNAASQTETVTGFTKGNKEATVGAETF
jgi:hypothetical protein